MSDSDFLRGRFGVLSGEDLRVPPADRVIRRGRQRRRKARVQAAAAVAAVALIAAGASQLAMGAQQHRAEPGGPGASPRRQHAGPALPPAGSGALLLVRTGGNFAINRLGSKDDLLRDLVPGLTPVGATFEQLTASDPAGGWVVIEETGSGLSNGPRHPSRLATVSVSGDVRLFGPAFSAAEVPSGIAVSPDASAVAVALPAGQGGARIRLVPLPGHAGAARSWNVPNYAPGSQDYEHDATLILTSLSFENDHQLTYLPGSSTDGGLDVNGIAVHGAVTFTLAPNVSTAPAATDWPPSSGKPGSCQLSAGAWDGGRYVALEQCAAGYVLREVSSVTGARDGWSVSVPGRYPCVGSALFPDAARRELLINSCGSFRYAGGRLAEIPLVGAPAGGQ